MYLDHEQIGNGVGSRNLWALFFPVLFDVRDAPGGEVDVLGSGEDDEAVPDPADGEVCRLSIRLVRAHNSATVARSSILNLQCIAHSQMLHG